LAISNWQLNCSSLLPITKLPYRGEIDKIWYPYEIKPAVPGRFLKKDFFNHFL